MSAVSERVFGTHAKKAMDAVDTEKQVLSLQQMPQQGSQALRLDDMETEVS
jgi:hypothetical protein